MSVDSLAFFFLVVTQFPALDLSQLSFLLSSISSSLQYPVDRKVATTDALPAEERQTMRGSILIQEEGGRRAETKVEALIPSRVATRKQRGTIQGEEEGGSSPPLWRRRRKKEDQTTIWQAR